MTNNKTIAVRDGVFTLQSIKSRIETYTHHNIVSSRLLFLLYSPLNQGLKQIPKKEK